MRRLRWEPFLLKVLLMADFRLTLVQPNLVWENPDANFKKISALLADKPKTDLILLPEMFPTGFSMNPAQNFEEDHGPALRYMQELAAEHNAAVSGSVIVKEGENYYNRLYFVWPEGRYRHYDKRHLFSYAGEEKVYNAGEQHLLVEHRGWKLMPLICYDLRFPVWCRNTAAVDLQFYVANWPERRATAWKSLLKARAIENMCVVAGLNRVGADANEVEHSGDSMVFDELGEPLLELSPSVEECATVVLDQEKLRKSRERFRFLDDRDHFTFLRP